jgi:excinuclease ABC subunit C
MIKLSFDNKKILNHFKGLIPSSSGCYFFLNKEKEIVYIGKAKNICKRVQSHFNKGRLSKFISFILYLDFIVTKNEKEALILEKKLITKHAPRFNFLLKDDTDYPYIEITSGDYPNYRLTRKPNEKFLYFGPFPNGSKAREILQVLERIFPLAKCKGTNKKKLTPCFYYSIDRCSGCCFKKIGKDYYDEKISLIKKFFSGDTKFSKKLIMRSIDNNIEKLSFEIAKKEKRILDSIDLFTSTQNIVISRSENCDFFCYVLKKKYLLLLISTYNNGT